MQPIFSWLSKYGKVLYGVTIIIAILFQLYWINESFRISKQRLLQQVEFTVRKDLTLLNLQKVYSLVEIFPNAEQLKFDYDSIINNVKDLTIQNRTKVGVTSYLNSIQAEVDDSVSAEMLRRLKNVEGYDSILYFGLKKEVELLSKASFTVYYHSGDRETNYPRYATEEKKFEASSGINVENGTYQIYIEHLNQLIFKSISGQLVFSFFYLLLFIITIGMLMYIAKIRKILLESKNSFTRNMTHELKIPTSTLQVAIESMDKYYNNSHHPEVAKYISYMKHSLGQLSSIIDAILNTARMEEGKATLHIQSIDVNELIKEVMNEMSLQIKNKEAQLLLEEKDHVIAELDPLLIKHVLVNLIDNSLKYSLRKPAVKISIKKNETQLVITVADNGKGIPENYVEEIFQPYFRIENKDTHDVKGYGLGLSHAREVIQLHQGTIGVERTDAEGTTIKISMPLTRIKK